MSDVRRATKTQMPGSGEVKINGEILSEWAARYFTEEGHTDEDKAVPGYNGRLIAMLARYQQGMRHKKRRDC